MYIIYVYLSPEAATLSFFDPHVLVDTKRNMKPAFRIDTEEDNNIILYGLNPKESIGILNKGLEDFICVRSMKFFECFKINTNFFTTDPSKWDDDENFKKIYCCCQLYKRS